MKQLLAGQRLAAPHDVRNLRVVEVHVVQHTALATKVQVQPVALHGRVAAPQCGDAERMVLARIAVVADAHPRRIEQPHDRRQHGRTPRRTAVARRGRQRVGHVAPNLGQRLAEFEHAFELVAVARGAPVRVVAVLLAAARVAPGGLDVAVGQRADPDIGVRGRDRELGDALQLVRIGDALGFGIDILERIALGLAPDARQPLVVDMNEARHGPMAA